MDTDNLETPWYQNGLHFTCTQCGKCCTGAPGYVWLNDAEADAIAAHLQMPLHEFVAIYTRLAHRGLTLREKANGDCILFDPKQGCTVYHVRPGQCRTWPFWESNIKTPSDWQRTVDICPGSGEGELIPVEEITRRLNVIRL
jgi:Fe-S-cluster containining protein